MNVLHFIGTAADHLRIAERHLAEAKRLHQRSAHLYKRVVMLKARCAALGAE